MQSNFCFAANHGDWLSRCRLVALPRPVYRSHKNRGHFAIPELFAIPESPKYCRHTQLL